MSKRALVIASVASMIQQFNMSNLNILQEIGYEVVVACNFKKGNTCNEKKIEELKEELEKKKIKFFQIDFSRNVLEWRENYKAYMQVKKLIKSEKFDLIHCHSPIGGFLTRIVARNENKERTKVIYTAHGFHFYEGAPKLNWLIYYPIEKVCSRWTDILITINHEDYELAKRKMHAKDIKYVQGVGVDTEKLRDTLGDRIIKRRELGIPEKAFLLVSVGELNANKNHEVVIRALAQLKNPNIHYVIAGNGALEGFLNDLIVQLDIKENVHLLGYRDDIAEIYNSADICCFPSVREGLGVAAIEGMALGLPIIAADNRGTREYVRDGENGYLINCKDVLKFATKIEKLEGNRFLAKEMGKKSEELSTHFDIAKVNEKMKEIYSGGKY